jgi:hypothetical protein
MPLFIVFAKAKIQKIIKTIQTKTLLFLEATKEK